MKCVAVVNTQLIEPAQVQLIDIEGQSIPFSLVHYNDLSFDKLGDNMVLVRKEGFSLNYRDKSLCMLFSSKIKENSKLGNIPIGSEFVATVEKVGKNVSHLKPGDRVISNHAYPDSGVLGAPPGIPSNHSSKEYDVLHYGKLLKAPPNMSTEVAASISLNAQTAYSMIRKARIKKNDEILITSGSANTSLFLINALKSRTSNVTVITTKVSAIEKFYHLGIKKVLFYDQQKDFADESQDWSREIGLFDVIFDPLHDIYFSKTMEKMKSGGRYLSCGSYNQFRSYENDSSLPDIREILNYIILKNISIIGNCLGSTADLKNALLDFENNKFNVIIDSVYNAENIYGFLQSSFNKSARFGKVSFLF